MARPPKFSSEEKLRIVLSVLRGEGSIAETVRCFRVNVRFSGGHQVISAAGHDG
jgi:transposase-like protein